MNIYVCKAQQMILLNKHKTQMSANMTLKTYHICQVTIKTCNIELIHIKTQTFSPVKGYPIWEL